MSNKFSFVKKTLQKSLNSSSFSELLLILATWKVGLLIITFLGLSLLPTIDFYNKSLALPGTNNEYWNRWANWDGKGYLEIAEKGYTPGLTVLFPLYPLSIRFLESLGINPLIAGLIISHSAFFIGCYFFVKLAQLDHPQNEVKNALFSLLIYPTSFYFGAVYSESLTFAFIISSFYFARKQNWWAASLLAGLAASSRLIGLGAIAALFIEYFFSNKRNISVLPVIFSLPGRIISYLIFILIIFELITSLSTLYIDPAILGIFGNLKDLIWVLIGSITSFIAIKITLSLIKNTSFTKQQLLKLPILFISFIPFCLYLIYQQYFFSSPLMFINQQVNWGRTLNFPWVGLVSSLNYIKDGFLYINEYSAHIHFRLTIFIISIVALYYSFKRQRLSYRIFFLIGLFLPLFTGTLADITRYTLLLFPMFLLFGEVKNEYLQKTGSLLAIMSLALLSILFINSYFFI